MRAFEWKSRKDCVSVVASRMYLQQITAEEALDKSLGRYCENGDLISKRERRDVLMDACMLANEARVSVRKRKKAM